MAFQITVRQEGKGDAIPMEIPHKGVQLRDMQKALCQAFKQRFPSTMASVTVNGKEFDEFQNQPFKEGAADGCVVKFKPTDDPYFYDLADRKEKVKLDEQTQPQLLPAIPDLRAMCMTE